MRRAFTLIELLVVIAIIAILAGMLMPALERARAEARKASCTANVHNVGLYLKMYAETYDGWPRAGDPGFTGDVCEPDASGDVVYDSSLTIACLKNAGFVDTMEVFICPATNNKQSMSGFTVDVVNGYTDAGADDYVEGGEIDWDDDDETKEYRFASNVSESCDPSYLIDPLVPFNSNPGRVVYGDGPDMEMHYQTATAEERESLADDFANHGRGAVVLFFDSSTKYLVMKQTGACANDRVEANEEIDENIYADDNIDGDYDEDTKIDCILGNHRSNGTQTMKLNLGPKWDYQSLN